MFMTPPDSSEGIRKRLLYAVKLDNLSRRVRDSMHAGSWQSASWFPGAVIQGSLLTMGSMLSMNSFHFSS
jgi:hypothetical protein